MTDARLTECLRGAFDLNCRCAPSAPGYVLDHWEAAEAALALAMGGLVFRDDGYCTTPIAALLAETEFLGKPILLSGSVTLNSISGGMNAYAAEHALMLHGRIVSMPTVSAENHLRMSRWPSLDDDTAAVAPPVVAALDQRGRVTAEVIEVLETVASRDGVLDAGSLHVSEILTLFAEARRLGVRRLLVSDPVRRNACAAIDISELVDTGAVVEFLPRPECTDVDLVNLVLEKAPEQLVLGLDIGPSNASTLRDRYGAGVRFWVDLGLDLPTIKGCISSNIARLLGVRPGDAPKPSTALP